MDNNPWLKNLWFRSAGMREDWSWLECGRGGQGKGTEYADLVKSEWTDTGREKLLTTLCFPPVIIEGCKNRMVMGAMRYGKLSGEGYKKYSGKYYSGRIAREVERADKTLEGISDGLNLLFLARLAGHITKEEEYKQMKGLRILTHIMVRSGVQFIGEDRNNATDI